MTEKEAIKVLQDLFDYGSLPEHCLSAINKGITALQYQEIAKKAVDSTSEKLKSFIMDIGKYDAALDIAASDLHNAYTKSDQAPEILPTEYEIKERWKRTVSLK